MDGLNVMPARPSHTGRNIFIVIGAVVVVALGFAAAKYWPSLVSPSAAVPDTTQRENIPQPTTSEQKAQVLQQVSAQAQTAATTTPADRAKILESAQTQTTTSAPAPSQEDKMKILQSLHQ